MNISTAAVRTPARALKTDSRTGNLWWLLTPIAALFYPQAVSALYKSGKLLHREGGPGGAISWLVVAASVGLVYTVPAVGITTAWLLGRRETISSAELLARRVAHLAAASPSLFVLIGVVFYLLHFRNADSVCWLLLWMTILAIVAWTMRKRGHETTTSAAPNSIPLRVAHGTSAALILVIFLSWHLLNHASAAFGPELNQTMMISLRRWYRSEWVQPGLVTLMLLQVASGVVLLYRATAVRSDLYRTLQTSSGAFLAVFITSHLNSVFILGRAVSKVDTTFLWASGAPVGLLPDVWNVRLIPHYSLGVWFVITHMGLGLRSVLLAHRVSPVTANRITWVVSAIGAVFALTITFAQLRVHGPS